MPLWLAARPLVLASKSAARRALLEAAGIPIEIAAADIAQQLGISTHMVKKYLGQALVHCRRRMARLG